MRRGIFNGLRVQYWRFKQLGAERHTCLAREGKPSGPLGFGPENEDRWIRKQWGTGLYRWYVKRFHENYAMADRINKWRKKFGLRTNWMYGGTRWKWNEQPRTCSYCGSVHPKDAVDLIMKGWRIEPTTKNYKFYLEPPHGDPSPIPPVKLYGWHLDPEKVKVINQAVDQYQELKKKAAA